MSQENHPPASKQSVQEIAVSRWRGELHERNTDLADLVLAAQGCLLLVAPEGTPQATYNRKLRRIISAIQDLCDELGTIN